MSGGNKLSVGQAYPAAVKLRDLLAPACERIEFAGSLRRAGGESSVMIGDLELVALPKPARLQFGLPAERQVNALESVLGALVDQHMIQRWPVDLARAAWGPKYKKFWIPVAGQWLQVDLFIADDRNFGSVFTIRTGSREFVRALMIRFNSATPYQQTDGYLIDRRSGEIVPVPTEAEYFARAGVQWIPPEKRIGPSALVPVPSAEQTDTQQDDQSNSQAQTAGQLSLF